MYSRRPKLRRTLLVSSAALAAGLAVPAVAHAAPLLPCTGTLTDLRAQLALQANANANGGPLDDAAIKQVEDALNLASIKLSEGTSFTLRRRTELENAWPSKLEIGSLTAGGTPMVVERLTVSYERCWLE